MSSSDAADSRSELEDYAPGSPPATAGSRDSAKRAASHDSPGTPGSHRKATGGHQGELFPSDPDAPESRQGLRHVTMTAPESSPEAALLEPATDPYLGATVDGRYEIEALLGEGGMGVVYRCIHTIIGKRVAMKVLRADLARNDEVVGRFLNEARSASSIGNPHIIDISDFGRLPDGATYFVMEYLDGSPLSAFLEVDSLLPPERIGPIMIQLTDALQAAHAAGIVHRDLKPDNIFLIQRGAQHDFVKVLDFGIAKASTESLKLTQAGQVFGTPHYMSPEQAAGADVDHRADIYAVGVMLYELLTGTLPFDAENFMGILTQHMYKEPPPPSSREGAGQRIAPPLEAIVMRCLQKAPGDRYQSMQELGDELRLLFTDPSRASLSDIRYSQLGSYAQLEPRGRKRIFATAVVLASLLGGGAAWYIAQHTSAKDLAERELARPNATSQAPSLTDVTLTVMPAHAEVRQGEKLLGTAPLSLKVGRTPLQLSISAPGFLPKELSVDGSQPALSVALPRLREVSADAGQKPAATAPARSADSRDKSHSAPTPATPSPPSKSSRANEAEAEGAKPQRPGVRRPSPASADLLVDPWGGD